MEKIIVFDKKDIYQLIGLCVLMGLIIGIFVSWQYFEYRFPRNRIAGVWFSEENKSQVVDYIRNNSHYGSWACIDLYNENPRQLLITYNHEISHAIFNEVCTDRNYIFNHDEGCVNIIGIGNSNLSRSELTEKFADVCQYDIYRCLELIKD